MDQIDSEFPKSLTIDEVELNTNYALIINTNAGLWRYRIGDTIKFTSRYPHRIKISGRTKHFINAFGEELIIENADSAITRACEKTGISVKDYTAGPVYMEGNKKGGHEWIIETNNIGDKKNEFLQTLDECLCSLNSDYDAKRKNDMALLSPKIHFVTEGTFYNWMQKRGKLGGQHKVPRLSNHREFVDDIIQFCDLR
jgi:hypothetical protein